MAAVNDLRPGVNPVLRGPADADHYRVNKGRFADRWYIDPLPADGTWALTDAAWPSVSTVKKAADKDWSFITIRRIADALFANPRCLEHCTDLLDLRAALTAIDHNGLHRDGDRGTNVHLGAQALLEGWALTLMPTAPGHDWLPALRQFFHDYQPRLVAAEVVVINRTLNGWGYGGTFDAIIEIDGRSWLIDWKSRGRESAHAAYPHEACQLGAYYAAEYCIATDPSTGAAVRVPMPELAGGLVISVRTDGYRVFPIDLELAYERNFVPLHAYWCARRDDTKAIGRHWAPLPISASYALAPDRLRERVTALLARGLGTELQIAWPDVPWGRPVTEYTPEQLDRITEAVRKVEDLRDAPFNADDAPTPPAPPTLTVVADNTEQPADPSAIEALALRASALSAAAKAGIARVTREAQEAGVSLSLRLHPTVRRFEIGRALIVLAETNPPEPFDDGLLRHLLAMVMTDPTVEHPSTTLGAAVARLTVEQARQLANLASAIGSDALRVRVTAGGAYEIDEVTP